MARLILLPFIVCSRTGCWERISPRGIVHACFPAWAAGWYFAGIFPQANMTEHGGHSDIYDSIRDANDNGRGSA